MSDYKLGGDVLPHDKMGRAKDFLEAFRRATPWPHLVIDDFFDESVLASVLEEYDGVGDWKTFNTKYEGKGQMNADEQFGPKSRTLFHALNSEPFLRFLSQATGIERLVSDPYFVGGGYHQIPRGGKLGVHVDFNIHPTFQLYRRLNVIIYLNRDWEESFGGHFQLWSKKSNSCEKKVLPKFNRMAIFETTNESFHGHPEPLNCPEGVYRRSMALYYYSPDKGGQKRSQHSTIFMKEDGSLEELGKPSVISRLKKQFKRLANV